MTPEQAESLHAIASRVVDESWFRAGDASALAKGVLELLRERDTGKRLAEDRFDAEIRELRDELHTGLVKLSARVDAHAELLGQHSYALATHGPRA